MGGKVEIKTASDLQAISSTAQVSMRIMRSLFDAIEVGKTTLEIDQLAAQLCEKEGAIPAFKGVVQSAGPFQHVVCISRNAEVLHAVPSSASIFKEGDVVKLDFGIQKDGFFTDHCVTFGLGKLDPEAERLIRIGKLAVESGVKQATAGNYTGDIGYAIQSVTEMAGFNVIKEFVGHGIGSKLHLDPAIYAYGDAGTGDRLSAGMVICVEAQIVAGDEEIYLEEDGWTVKTVDGNNGVMFEYMVHVTASGPEILTDTRDWPLVK